jgi:TetR/AcrR family transcriptional repressor of mexJK operon
VNTSVQKPKPVKSPGPRSSGGRPRDPAKDRAILARARDIFFERGFNGAAMEEVAARAGVSKVTLYKRFADKEALFEAVVRREVDRMAEDFEAWPYADGSLAEQLDAYGSILLRFLFSTQHLLLNRMLSNEFAAKPDMARRFYDAGPGACRARLAALLAQAADRGEIVIDNSSMAAADIFSLWTGWLQKELDFGMRSPPIPGELIDERVQRGTRLFLKAVSPD